MKTSVKIVQGDITKLKVDAIVNAANSTLLGGGGVDGAIHRAAGPQLLEECRSLNGCETGDAKITAGYKLNAEFVIHTVGPVWNGGNKNEDKLLASCYTNSLRLAESKNLTSIAFPSISTGVYGFPFSRACKVALDSIQEFIIGPTSLEEILLVTFSKSDLENYKSVFNKHPLSKT